MYKVEFNNFHTVRQVNLTVHLQSRRASLKVLDATEYARQEARWQTLVETTLEKSKFEDD